MKRASFKLLYCLNIVLVASLLFGPMASLVTASQVSKPVSNLAPSESIEPLVPDMVQNQFVVGDPTTMAIQQAMGNIVDPDMLDIPGLVNIEPLGNNDPSPDINSSVGANLPSAVVPVPNRPQLPEGHGVDAFQAVDDDGLTDELPLGEMDDGGKRPLWSTFNLNPLPYITSLYAPESDLPQPPPGETSSWVAPRPDSSATAPLRPQQEKDHYQSYLPIIHKSDVEPSNTIIALPDKETVLMSTDGLLRLVIPNGAVDTPTQINYRSSSTDNPNTPQGTTSHAVFSLNASDTATGNPITQFNKPLAITLLLPDSLDVSTIKQVMLGTWTQEDGWENLPTIPNPAESAIFASTEHFTHFELLSFQASVADSFILAPHIPAQTSIGILPFTFYGYSTEYEFTGGPISLYPVEEDGTHLWTDDNIEITVYRPDGTQYTYAHDYDLGGPGINPTLPIDITNWFITGTNGIEIALIDKIDPSRGSSGYQIAAGSACESVPPRVQSIDLSQTGQNENSTTGTAIITVFATDNAGEVDVTISLNGIWYQAISYGNNQYILTVDYPVKTENTYVVNVVDSCGNQTATAPIKAYGTMSQVYGPSHCGKDPSGGCGGTIYQRQSGDPVNTANGNYYEQTMDLFVAGTGDSDLIIERSYNSFAALWTGGATIRYIPNGDSLVEEQVAGPPQYFGTGWTFPYAVSLNIQSYPPYYDGVQVAYPDGHTANFIADDNGIYISSSPANFDTLTKEGNGYVLQHKNTLEIERFDANGRLTSREDRNGNTITLTYDGDYLSRVENDSGRWIEFAYTDGFITTITAPENRVITYGYTDELLTSVTDGNDHTTLYGYDDNNQLETITTPEGHTSLDQVYDDEYRVDWQKIGRAEINDFTYSEDGLTTTITDSYQRDTIYIYNELGQIVEMVDALGFRETYGYNEKYQRTNYTDQLGREWHWTYDDNGNRLTEDGPLGWYQEWDYNDLNRVTSQTTKVNDSLTRTTTFTYDSKGNLTGIENALGDSSSITYNDRGLPTNVFDFNQNETVNTYDPTTGDLIETRNGAGDTVGYSYDGLGRMVEMTNGRGFVYEYAYDDADNLTDINGPMGYHIGYRYDDNDNLEQEIDPNDGVTQYWYDESEMVVRIENQLDYPTIFEYDDMDNLIRMEDAEGREWFYEYDELYRQTAVHAPHDAQTLDSHTLFEYDAVGNVLSTIECRVIYDDDGCPDNRTTTYAYNALDQMETIVENFVDGAGETADSNVTTEFEYDLVGNLLVLTDALDNQTLFEYDLLDQLVREEDAESQVTEYEYDANGNLVLLTNPRDYETEFTYDGANRLETMTDADNQTWAYRYDGNGNLTHEIDPFDVVTYYRYDALDRVNRLVQNFRDGGALTSDQNVTTQFEYDLAGNLRFIDDSRGDYVTEHQYDAAHRRILTIDNEDGETEYGYDKVNNLISLMDGNDHETTFVYDALNRQIKITNPENHSVEFVYDRLGNTLAITVARGYATTFTYDGMNRVVEMEDALEGVWEYSYDAMGNVQCEIDANLHANDCYTYDDVYRVLSITDAEGHTDEFTYDANGNRLTWTDGNDHTTTYTYDVVDRLATMTNAENETTRYDYDPLGNQTYLIEADDIVTRYDYDPLYRLVTVNQNDQPGQPETADVNVDTHYVYDEVGNLLTIIDAELHETSFAYDGMNRNIYEIDADGNEWEYDYDYVGNRIWRIDANGNRTDYTYYPDNQPETISYELDGTMVEYAYDENNNQVEMVDHLGTTTWVYDPLNRVTSVNDAFGRVLGYGYDAVGNRTSLTYNDGRSVTYSYYDNNWLKTAVDPENNITSYERDGVGMMTTTTNPNETITTATYDKANRLLTLVNQEVTGAQKTNSAFAYTYNEVGHRTQMVAEYGWRNPAVVTSDYTYDGLRRLIRDEDSEGVWTDYTFDRVGNRLVLNTNDDSLSPRPFDEKTVYYSYSDANRLLSLVGNTHPGSPGLKWQDNVGQTIYAFRHEVAAQRGKHINEFAADNLLGMADNLIAVLEGNPKPDEPDVLDMIEAIRVQVQSDWTGSLITSDGIANSLLVKLRLGDEAANNGANNEWQTQIFTYDANGNRINTEYPGPQGPRVQGTDYTYDPENRLIVHWDYQMNLQGNRVDRAITTMEYDGGGRRLSKTYDANDGSGGAKRVEYVFDGWDPVSEYNDWNPQYENFYRGDMNRIITMHHFPSGTEGQMYWYHYDGLGSVSGLTKQHGQSHHNYRYEPYGQIEMPPGNFTDPHNHYTFTGQEWDENMGLYEFYARDYDPVTGAWLSQDTYRGDKQQPMSLHRYQYVYNAPTNYVDVYGHFPWLLVGVVVVIAIVIPSDVAQTPSSENQTPYEDQNYYYDDGYNDVNCSVGEPVTQVTAIGPFDALNVRNNLVPESFEVANNTGLTGPHNGPQDAFRHCYWSCRMAQEIGATQAEQVGTTHESCGGNPEAERIMDLHNNMIGRGLASGNCEADCMSAFNNGDLIVNEP